MPGRNDACPCGSGKKFKNCCVDKGSGISKGLLLLIAAVVTIAAIGIVPFVLGDREEGETRSTLAGPAPVARRTPQPGPAPAGKVWSPEHGHWHDAPTRNVMPLQAGTPTANSPVQVQSAPAPTFTPGPQPPGPVPAGKVWSTEHGHWHDLPK
jgi:hypothetical protein